MKSYNSDMKFYNPNANLITIACVCGHKMNFLKPFPRECSNCGRLVTPVRKKDFKENVMKAREKNEYCNN